MKTKNIFALTIGMIFIMIIMSNFVSAEMSAWGTEIRNQNDSTLKAHYLYWFDDTNLKEKTNKEMFITLNYVIQPLPLDLMNGRGYVDWCNFTITKISSDYADNGDLINTTTTYQSLFFSSSPLSSGYIPLSFKRSDMAYADILCHYTDANYIYADNVLAGRITTYMDSFACAGCTQYSLEELSHQTEKEEAIADNGYTIYSGIQQIVDWNFTIWLVLSWILKIGFILVGVGLIFGIVYYYYIFFRDLGHSI